MVQVPANKIPHNDKHSFDSGSFVFYFLMVAIANVAGMRGFGVTRGGLRLVASVPAIVIIGMLIQQNGFKFAFTVKNSAKAILITSPLILALLLAPLQMIGQVEPAEIFVPQRLEHAFADLATGIFEEVLFRGLFINLLVVMLVHAFNNIISNLVYTGLYPALDTKWFPFFWVYNFTLPDAVFLLAVVALVTFAIIKAEPFSRRFSLIKLTY